MNYILIQNDGEIELNSFELIGASTKRDDSEKIGFFGSGLKYSIAYMIRNNIGFRIFSGESEITFSTQTEMLREKQFERICINGQPTSYTTTMGPTWTEDWFVLREIYCNALDEPNCQLIKSTSEINPSEGKTRIYIELTEKLKTIVDNWDKYFSEDRTPLFVTEDVYTSSLGSEDGHNYVHPHGRCQPVTVYNKTDGILYRRGIKVEESELFIYDYEFKFININEDRRSSNTNYITYAFADMMGLFVNEGYVLSVLRNQREKHPSIEYKTLRCDKPTHPISEKWIDFSKRYLLVVEEISGRFKESIEGSSKELLLLPSYFAKCLKKKHKDIYILGMSDVIGDGFFELVDKTYKIEFLLKETLEQLKQMQYIIEFPINVCEFGAENTLGHADIKGKQIYISPKLFDKGRREIALCLIEENEHIISGHGDFTREFQNHLFSKWLSTMEKCKCTIFMTEQEYSRYIIDIFWQKCIGVNSKNSHQIAVKCSIKCVEEMIKSHSNEHPYYEKVLDILLNYLN